MFDRNRTSCFDCTRHWQRQGLEPVCEKCDKPKLLPENKIIDYLVSSYRSILVNDGSINPDGIRFVLELEEIEDRVVITQKLIAYLKTGIETAKEQN